ncbi:MAG TPA: alpha/beta fold hydrolase [Bacteroidia bacterium]|nr:alpha/beta fold hydrolase [Bacteroidia bacterium]
MKLFFRKSGDGQPLFILHGLFGSSDNWAGLAKQWSQYFTVYTVDLRNHGQSPHSEEWNYSVMAEDLMELIAAENLRGVNLLGHSMGGKAAMRLALDFQQALSKLIVSDIGTKKYPDNNRNVVDALLKVQPEKLTSRKEAEAILSANLQDPGTVQFLLKNLYWKETVSGKQLGWRFNLGAISKNLEAVGEATNSPAPCEVDTLFIRGERSDYITAADEQEIKRVFPHSKIVTVPNAGHWVHADNPQGMFNAVMEFCG